MKITLVYPAYKFKETAGFQEPLGIMSVAASLKKAGHSVLLFDLTYTDSLDGLKKALRKSDMVGVYISTAFVSKGQMILDLCRGESKEIKTVAGGPHVSAMPEDMLELGFDFAVTGEGEESSVKLAAFIENPGGKIPAGVISAEYGKGDAKEIIQDLDSLPFPARELINQNWYVRYNNYLSMIVTRGCPYNCLYCKPMQELLFGNKIRRRGAESTIGEIVEITSKYRCGRIYFKDDVLFSAGKKWLDDFAGLRENKELSFTWMALARVDQINESLLKKAKQAGLYAISFGVETGSDRMLEYYQKGATVEQCVNAFDLCHKHGILTNANFMIGGPDETWKEALETVKLARRIAPHSVRVFTTTPMPGNDLYKRAKQEGRLKDDISFEMYSGSANNKARILPMSLDHLTGSDISAITRKIRRVVFWKNMLRVLTRPKDFIRALQNWKMVWHLVRDKL